MTTPTPTTNPDRPLRVGDVATLTEALDIAATGETGYNFYSHRGELVARLPYAELREEAIALARRLAAADLPRGSRVAIVAETTPDFVAVFFACQYAGLIPVPLPLPMNLGGRDAYVERLARMLESAGALVAVASEAYAEHVRAAAGRSLRLVLGPDELRALPASGRDPRPLAADEPCYIQYSSGSTRFPHGVTITQRSATSNCLAIIRHGLKIRPGDRCVSWLPLYHDMGLIGFCLAPMVAQLSTDYIATTDFARRPLLWLKVLSLNGGTLSFSPTFGYGFCLQRASNGYASSFDLAAWRVAGTGGEMIRPDILDRFAETFAPSGFRRSAFVASYGLAESTLAVSFAPLDAGLQIDRIDAQRFAREHRAVPAKANGGAAPASRAFVVCGRPLPGHAVAIRDDAGAALPERRVGNVFVKGPSVMGGYLGDPDATAGVLDDDGWLDTGDTGYLADGALVVTGRRKDLIICNGRNIWPHDIEWAVERLPGMRRGSVAAFSVESAGGGETVVIVAECRIADAAKRRRLGHDIAATVYQAAGVHAEVVLVPPRSLPFTSSGKLSRSSTKERYLAGMYDERCERAPAAAPRPATISTAAD